MKHYLYFITVILVAILLYNETTVVTESFTPKINQMWRPHYRNLRLFASESFSTAQGSLRRYLRQTGVL
jgi:hypothetical protein